MEGKQKQQSVFKLNQKFKIGSRAKSVIFSTLSIYSLVPLSSVQPQNGKVPQQGCNQGFHRIFSHVSWFSAPTISSRCLSAALALRSRISPYRGSVSGVKGRDSEGSRRRS